MHARRASASTGSSRTRTPPATTAGRCRRRRWPRWPSKAVDALTPAERLAFIGNLGALFRNGTIHGDAYLDILGGFANDPDPQVLSTMLGALGQIRTTFDSAENRARFAAYLRRTIGPALDRIGFTPKEGESERITTLRPELLILLGIYGEDERVQAVRARAVAEVPRELRARCIRRWPDWS